MPRLWYTVLVPNELAHPSSRPGPRDREHCPVCLRASRNGKWRPSNSVSRIAKSRQHPSHCTRRSGATPLVASPSPATKIAAGKHAPVPGRWGRKEPPPRPTHAVDVYPSPSFPLRRLDVAESPLPSEEYPRVVAPFASSRSSSSQKPSREDARTLVETGSSLSHTRSGPRGIDPLRFSTRRRPI